MREHVFFIVSKPIDKSVKRIEIVVVCSKVLLHLEGKLNQYIIISNNEHIISVLNGYC